MQLPKIVLLIFVSGKIVLTGGKRREDIYQAFENIYPVLTEFKKLQLESDEADAGVEGLGRRRRFRRLGREEGNQKNY